jgi:hypothetical protein
MGLLVGTLVVIAIIFFMIVSPGFRIFAIGVLVLGGLGIFALIQNVNKENEAYQRQKAEQERWATTAIQADEVSLRDVTLSRGGGGSWTLKGAVSNNSKFNLGSISFLVTVRDCPGPDNTCQIIGQETTRTASGDFLDEKPLVPAGQLRLFQTYAMGFKNMPSAKSSRWEYKVTEVRAAH